MERLVRTTIRPGLTGFFLLATAFLSLAVAGDYYVAPAGNDAATGTEPAPWRTIQHAADTVSAGDTVHIRAGTYSERVNIQKSGSDSGGHITFQSYAGENPVLDGTALTPDSGQSALVTIENQSYIIINGLEIANFQTTDQDSVPIGLYVTGSGSHIQILNNTIHHIAHNNVNAKGGNAHGLAVYGADGANSINNLTISGNTVRNCTLGWSESLVLNGNVEIFTVSGNTIHDNDNIGIDLIGWEGTAPTNDQARNGTISGNTVYNISSDANPAYQGERSAAGIYVDGGKDIVIERNRIHGCDFGVEVASEHQGKTTENVTVRNNLLYLNNVTGIAFGGYDTNRGITLNCVFQHNTLFNNDTTNSGAGEIMIQMAHDNTVSCNLIYASTQNIPVTNYFSATYSYGNTFNYNLYYSPGNAADATFVWQNQEYTGFTSFQAKTGQDADSRFSDPLLADISSTPPDLELRSASPAIGAGDPNFDPASGEKDYAGNNRVINGRNDCGAYEYNPGGTTYTLSVTISPAEAGTVSGAGVYSEGTLASLGASAAVGYRFSGWSGDLTGTDNPASLTMESDKSVTAGFEEEPVVPDHITLGSVVEVRAAEVDSALSEFTKKPNLYVAYDDGNSHATLRIISSTPIETVLAEWTKKLLLYEKGAYNGKLIGAELANKPLTNLKLDGLFITVREADVYDQELNRAVYLEPPVITEVTGDPGEAGDLFKVIGQYFGSNPPKVMVEYLKNGDTESPRYGKCKIDKSASRRFRDARGNAGKSCMVVRTEDVTPSEALGYSEVTAEYPKLKNTDQATGYLIVDNGLGLASYYRSDNNNRKDGATQISE